MKLSLILLFQNDRNSDLQHPCCHNKHPVHIPASNYNSPTGTGIMPPGPRPMQNSSGVPEQSWATYPPQPECPPKKDCWDIRHNCAFGIHCDDLRQPRFNLVFVRQIFPGFGHQRQLRFGALRLGWRWAGTFIFRLLR